MNIITAGSEVFPFSKTGGLADVTGSIPIVISDKNNHCSIILPLYKKNYPLIKNKKILTKLTIDLDNNNKEDVEIISINHPQKKETILYFIKNDCLFCRNGIYSEDGADYPDNAKRFIVFSKAIVYLMIYLFENKKISFDILHIHDWQSALSALFIKDIFKNHNAFQNTKIVFTIHNIAYQGNFETNVYPLLNISWKYFVSKRLEHNGVLSFIKAGIILSDYVTTVSESYRNEILQFGNGMEKILSDRAETFSGVLNGIYGKLWNPSEDKFLKENTYSYKTREKKTVIKNVLYKKYKIKKDRLNYPLVSIVSRFDTQKGIDLIFNTFFELSTINANFIFLFSKSDYNIDYQNEFLKRAKRSENIKVLFEFNEELSHLLTAGSDIFLMPSVFEPSGLNQMYSMKYGTLPLVHAIGGLKDTVINYENEYVIDKATGFVFYDYNNLSFINTLDYALSIYFNKKEIWQKLIYNAMNTDYSIEKTANKYLEIYTTITNKK